MSSFFVPPGGFAGFSQMTPASRASLVGGARGAISGKRRRRKKRKSASGKRRKRVKLGTARKRAGRTASRGRGPKFGSPAWQKKYKVGKYAKKGS